MLWCIYINVVVFILLVQDSHFCYLFLGGLFTPSSETSLSFWEDSFTPVHESCNKHFTKCIRFVTLSTEWVTRVFCLNVRRRLDCVRHVRCAHVRHPAARHPAMSSQRARASTVGKTPSFCFCQVDMYGCGMFGSCPCVFSCTEGWAGVMLSVGPRSTCP